MGHYFLDRDGMFKSTRLAFNSLLLLPVVHFASSAVRTSFSDDFCLTYRGIYEAFFAICRGKSGSEFFCSDPVDEKDPLRRNTPRFQIHEHLTLVFIF